MCVFIFVTMHYIYIYIYTCVCVCVYIYIYIYIRTNSCNVINHVTNHDVKFAHILISDVVSNLTMMSHSLLPKLTVTHRTWSTFYFVLSARTLFMLVKHPTVLDFDLTITNTALNTIFLATL